MFLCNSKIDYAKLRYYKTENDKKEEQGEQYLLLYQILILLLIFDMLIRFDSIINAYVGAFISVLAFIIKFIISKIKKEKNYFLPVTEKNYIEIPYKIKSQAIDAKVTCHNECNPIKYLKDESNRIYVVYNSSGSLNKYLN